MGFVWTDDDDDDDNGQQQQQQQVPELPPAARKHLRQVTKELKEAREQLATLQVERRKTSVTDVLKAKGFDPAIADLIPSTVETSEEAIGKWLDDRSSIFAKTITTTDTPPAEMDTVDSATAAAFGQISNVEAGAMPPDKAKDLLARLNTPGLTRAQLDDIMRSGGAKF